VSKRVAVVGATGAVGQQMIEILESRDFPTSSVRFLASERSIGRTVTFRGEEHKIVELKEENLGDLDIALFSIPKDQTKVFTPIAVKLGCVVVDNSNAFRMEPDVPLVVPEVNPHAIKGHKGIIANPNCSTIQMVVALKPLHDAAKIKRIVVSTYQSVSGAGFKAVDELKNQSREILDDKDPTIELFPHQIAFNAIPQIPQSSAFEANGYTTEELKMLYETRKIMEDDSIRVTATTVRVPVFYAHSEAVNVEFENKITADEARALLEKAPGVKVVDDLDNQKYPLAADAWHRDEVFVGRIREDISCENGLDMWVVSDNLRKGAALNAVQIAEYLL